MLRLCGCQNDDGGDWEFDGATMTWVRTLFPSRLPVGRQEVLVCHDWSDQSCGGRCSLLLALDVAVAVAVAGHHR